MAVAPRRRALVPSLLLAALFASACAPQSRELYAWYDYEAVLYDTYANPGAADPQLQVERLARSIARIGAEGRRVAPGMHAQLGYALYLTGSPDGAIEQFRAEKASFPESAVLMDRLIDRILGASTAPAPMTGPMTGPMTAPMTAPVDSAPARPEAG